SPPVARRIKPTDSTYPWMKVRGQVILNHARYLIGLDVRPTARLLSPDEQQLLERFSAEVEASAASCAVLMTYHAAADAGYSVRLPRPHETILPYVPLTVAAVIEAPFAVLVPASRLAIIRELPTHLDRAKAAMENVIASTDIPAHRKFADAIEAAMLPISISSACLAVVLDDLAGLAEFAERPVQRLSFRRLRGALLSALDGGTPLLSDGMIEIPDTSIVIRGMRRSVDLEAKFSSYGRAWRVRVVNISQGGYCISGVDGITPGSPARLQLPGGRILDGSVKWVDGARAGVRLGSRLLLADPLLNQ
ncbi:MAG: hypothetical protein K2Y05_12910, partial [Hyphomicrobiaceae bacterium]|nr:hypothetical protein [Hyphomicrobiaceae bacterium]